MNLDEKSKSILVRPTGRIERIWRWFRPASALALTVIVFAIFGPAGESEQRRLHGTHDIFADVFVGVPIGTGSVLEIRNPRHANRRFASTRSRIDCVAFGPDGSQIASGGIEDKNVILWNTATGTRQHTLVGHEGSIQSVQFTTDGRRIASGSFDGDVRIWDAKTGQNLLTIGTKADVHCVAFSPSGKKIASGSGTIFAYRFGSFEIWDAASGKLIRSLEGHEGRVNDIAFSRDGKRIASGSHDKKVKVWDAATGKLIRTLEGHTGPLNSVCFSPDGTLVASSGWYGVVKVWETRTGKAVFSKIAANVGDVRFSPSGDRILAAVGSDLKIWDIQTGDDKGTLRGHTSKVAGFAFSPNGRRIVSCSWDRTIRLWDYAESETADTPRAN